MKILMVCLGNICRSPLAEGVMQQLAQKNGLNWEVDSAGTGNWHCGEPPHRLSQKIARHYGFDIGKQKARQLIPEDFERYDRIFFMDEQNLEDARSLAGRKFDEQKASLLLDVLYPGQGRSVPDPYYGGEQHYHETYHLVKEACEAIVSNLRKNADA